TFSRAKGWEPQRVEYAMGNGLRALGPRQTGPNMLVYSNKLLESSNKPGSSWFHLGERSTLGSSFAATPYLSDDEEGDLREGSPRAKVASTGGARVTNSIRDFEESINTGFQLAMQSGPLCLEPFAGVAVTIKEFLYNGEDADSTPSEPNRASSVHGAASTAALSGQIITTVRDAIKTGFLHWSPRLHLAMYTCDIQATSDVLGKVYGVISRRRGRILSEEMREGTPYFIIKASIPIVESFGFADEIRKRTSGAAIPLLIFRGFEPLDTDPFWVPTTEEELEDLGEKADRDNVAKKYMDKVRKRKGLFVERKIVEHAEKQRTLKK
ncbi:Cytoplasmic GTPase/eEF2-like protein (ribosomal biogenesis), partial [Coemansia guatemalensis]